MNTSATPTASNAKHETQNATHNWHTVAFQGVAGAYAHIAARTSCPQAQAVSSETFAAAIAKVESGECDGACLPVENNSMGRIADIHALLPHTTLKIVGEYYLPVTHCLIGLKGAKIDQIQAVYSQLPALEQCKATMQSMGLKPEAYIDTAGSAKWVSQRKDPTLAAIASSLAAEVYPGLEVLKSPMNDHAHNTTRFLLLGRESVIPALETPTKTTLLFKVKDIPAALYKALGGFATNGINLSRLESYLVGGTFKAAEFFVDIEAHPQDPRMLNAMDELAHFTTEIRHMGSYPSAT